MLIRTWQKLDDINSSVARHEAPQRLSFITWFSCPGAINVRFLCSFTSKKKGAVTHYHVSTKPTIILTQSHHYENSNAVIVIEVQETRLLGLLLTVSYMRKKLPMGYRIRTETVHHHRQTLNFFSTLDLLIRKRTFFLTCPSLFAHSRTSTFQQTLEEAYSML